MKWDRHGLRLADVPNAGVVRRDANARSGNPSHDVRSGKFGAGGNQKPGKRTAAPPNTDPVAYKRMLDAARDAARSLGTIDEANIQAFIQDRAQAPETVDIANFMATVQEARKAYVLDVLDDALRDAEGSKTIKVSAPDGVVAEYMRALGSDVVAEIMTRLEGMGHDRSEVDRIFDDRFQTASDAKKIRDSVSG